MKHSTRSDRGLTRHVVAWCWAGAALIGGQAHAQNVQYAPGKVIFDSKCVVCHQAGGKGQDGLAPPLIELPGRYAAHDEGRQQLTMTVLNGMFGAITVDSKTYNFKMPSFKAMSDEDLADVLNYVVFDLNAKHDGAKPFTAADVKAMRASPMDGAKVREHRDVALKSIGS
ncbi:c-type cytochrome [Trinickia dinghuensis]|uniref:Cytochrome c n=1 Tax=Trinickia dinghuensis TaxID=2291023 RepID=A0A3D8JSX9_9BURK|nr:cytochrome c [Trinickia dinghuensis]RDU96239.1 cytochrome c [Trinickia dinghuensis]